MREEVESVPLGHTWAAKRVARRRARAGERLHMELHLETAVVTGIAACCCVLIGFTLLLAAKVGDRASEATTGRALLAAGIALALLAIAMRPR